MSVNRIAALLPTRCSRGPRYTAWAGPDSYVESGDDLDTLLALIEQRQDGFGSQEVAVWKDGRRLVAVVLPDGTVIDYRRDRR